MGEGTGGSVAWLIPVDHLKGNLWQQRVVQSPLSFRSEDSWSQEDIREMGNDCKDLDIWSLVTILILLLAVTRNLGLHSWGS